jgi:ferredoxin
LTARIHLVVDRELCIGSGMCLVHAPNTFKHDEDAKAVVARSGGDPAGAVSGAVEACPTQALSLVPDEEGA